MMGTKLQVAVIGGGAAGLCAARHLLSRGDRFAPPVVYEVSDSVGGTWIYTDSVGTDRHGLPVHSSMYRNLRTNLPKEVMAFPGFPFGPHLPSFIHHSDVRRYLEEYAQHYGIGEHIKLFTEYPLPISSSSTRSRSRTLKEEDQKSYHPEEVAIKSFTYIIIRNRHYSDPYIPNVPGMEYFQGQVMHSHEYRTPESFTGKRVVLLGAGPSGIDIALELSQVAQEVILSHSRPPIASPLPGNVIQAPGVDRLSEASVLFQDGTERRADAFILCTGYNYSFPFLAEEVGLKVEGGVVSPLYKYVVHTRFTSLCFIGLCKAVCPFPHFNCQVLFSLAVLDGSCPLPPERELNAATAEELRARLESGFPARHFHKLDSLQWDYNNELAQLGRFEPLSPILKELYENCKAIRGRDLINYKSYNYKISSGSSREWSLLCPQ
uniref:Flavin-containing monooxygenase n=1 Tax=Latimeria chalumnae TaxID=7897 RepID=H3A574_LATCH